MHVLTFNLLRDISTSYISRCNIIWFCSCLFGYCQPLLPTTPFSLLMLRKILLDHLKMWLVHLSLALHSMTMQEKQIMQYLVDNATFLHVLTWYSSTGYSVTPGECFKHSIPCLWWITGWYCPSIFESFSQHHMDRLWQYWIRGLVFALSGHSGETFKFLRSSTSKDK